MQSRGETDILFVDLSAYQVIEDEALLVSKSPAVILRAYGSNHTNADTEFLTRVAMFKTHNIPTGAYYFATPSVDPTTDGGAEVNAQCDQFIAVLEQAYGTGKYGDLIPFLDVEAWDTTLDPDKPMYYGLTGAMVLDWIKRFRDRFNTATKRKLGLYGGRWFFQQATYPEGLALTQAQLSELDDMPLWLAEYDEYNANQTDPSYIVPDWGGWTSFAGWQYDVAPIADTYGLSHVENKVDMNRIDSLDRLMPPPPATDIIAKMVADNSMQVSFSRPNVMDYIGSSIYINNSWKAWVDGVDSSAVIDITAYADGTDISIIVETQDAYLDVTRAEAVTMHVYATLAEAEASDPVLYPTDPDTDGDGIPDSEDPYPNDPNNTPPEGGNFMPTVAMGTTIKKTDGVAIAGLTSISGLDLSADTIDTTTLSSEGGYREFTSSFRDAGEVGISGYFDYTSHIPLLDDFQAGVTGSYVITFPNGATWTFDAVVVGFVTGAELEDLISFEGTLKVSGEPTLTAPVV